MSLILDIIVKFREMLKANEKSPPHPEPRKEEKQVMSDDEKLDQALKESFPASDPPGHILKSAEDLKQY
jgi:hypothetical protein